MGVFDFLKGGNSTGGNSLKEAVSPTKKNFLSQFLPEDEEKKRALARALMMGGANMMAAGGPSLKPTNFLQIAGQGLAGGLAGYDESIANDLAAGKVRAAQQESQLKADQAAQAAKLREGLFVGGDNGDMGYSIDQLKKYFEYQIATGDDAGARDTLGMIQKLQQEGASKGMVVGENGFEAAPGYNENLGQTERFKAGGRVAGEEAFRQTDDIREYNLYVKQTEAAGGQPEDFTTWMQAAKKAGATQVNVGNETDPGKGEIFKAMNEERENANQSARGLKLVYEMKKAIPNAITGFGADYLLAGRKAISALGGDSSAVVDTESLKTQAMELAANMKGDLVGNQQISNSDMEFVQRVAAGDMSLDAGTLKRLVGIREIALKGNIERYNSRVDQLYPDTPDNKNTRAFFGGLTVPEDPYAGQESGAGDGVVVVSTEAEFNALPVGTPFRFDDDQPGTRRAKR